MLEYWSILKIPINLINCSLACVTLTIVDLSSVGNIVSEIPVDYLNIIFNLFNLGALLLDGISYHSCTSFSTCSARYRDTYPQYNRNIATEAWR